MRSSVTILAIILVTGLVVAAPATIASDANWTSYQSDTGIFEVTVPDNIETKTSRLRLDERSTVSSSTVISIRDQRRYKGSFKSYLVRLDQTLGPALTHEQIEFLLSYELKNYIKRFEGMSPVVKKNEFGYYRNIPDIEMHIEYQDPELGAQNTRVRVLYTNASRIEISLTGDPAILYGFKADKFFDNLAVNEGIEYNEGSFGEGWDSYTSPLNVFSLSLPSVIDPYVPEAPKISKTQKSDLISQTFLDPVWGRKIFYRVHGYKFDRPLSQTNINEVLLDQHIKKYNRGNKGINFRKIAKKEHYVLESEMAITPPAKASYADFVRLRVYYVDKYMVVQEVISSRDLAKSPLADNLMDHVIFHPGGVEYMPPEMPAAPKP